MPEVEIYKVVTAGKHRRYPALIRKGLLRHDHVRGRCQAQFCKERSSFIRAWLNPDVIGQYVTAALNGVRYCREHTAALAAASQLPIYRTRSDLNAYHSEVVAHELAFPSDSNVIAPDPARSVRLVGPHGFIIFRTDGSFHCEALNGAYIPTCCLAEAKHQVGLAGKLTTARHSPGCCFGEDIAYTRDMARHRPLAIAAHSRAFVHS